MRAADAALIVRSGQKHVVHCHLAATIDHYSSSQVTFTATRRGIERDELWEFRSRGKAILSLDSFRMIYVTGLPRHMTSWELAEMCRPFGEVITAQIEHDPETGTAWRFGFVEFEAPESAVRAASALHGKRFRGDVLAARQIDRMTAAPEIATNERSVRRRSKRRPASESEPRKSPE